MPPGDPAYSRSLAAALALPALDEWQRRILARAVSFVGYPHVWGGASEREQAPFGVAAPGGFDCSGLLWRVYRTPFGDAPRLAGVLRGRTTFALSGEMRRAQRIPREGLQPADVVFFGDRGVRSRPADVDHAGSYLGGGRFVHASAQGVTLSPLAGWWSDGFAWARRPLAEAGL